MTAARRAMPELSRQGTARLRAMRAAGAVTDASPSKLEALAAAARACDLGAETPWLVEELAAAHASASEDETEIAALLLLCAVAAARQGSTCLPLDPEPGAPLSQLLGPIAAAAELARPVPQLARAMAKAAERAAGEGAGLIGGPGSYRPLILEGGCLYLQRHYARERRLSAAAAERAAQLPGDAAGVRAALADVLARPACPGGTPQTLSDEQAAAIEAAAAQRFTVVAGGPGTGKTAIIVALLRTLARAGTPPSSVALCAPTGKAAKRMSESIRAGLAGIADPADADRDLQAAPPEPQTLHRLLGYQPAADRFRHHENHPLPADVVIADEASMIDLELAERLFRAVKPDAKVILFGDADQLPSVDAGAVFRDFVTAGEAAGTARRLTRSYRMDPADPAGRAILVAARAVGRGEAASLLDESSESHVPVRESAEELAFEGAEMLDTGGEPQRLDGLLMSWHRRFLAPDPRRGELVTKLYRQRGGLIDAADVPDLDALFAHHAHQRLLAVTRQLATGAAALNAYFHARALEGLALDRRPDFVPGEPILMRKNDYRRQLFNGDAGLVLRVAADGGAQRFCAVFPAAEGYAAYPVDAIRPHIELAYALTVHQAQGSEYDCVALVLPHADIPLLSRELVYTALTRARRSAIIVGSRRLVARASRCASRFTRLST